MTNLGLTACHMCVIYDSVNCLEFLKESGGDIYALDKDGNLPIFLAAMYGSFECLRYLSEFSDLHEPNSDGNSGEGEQNKVEPFF